MTIDAPRLLAFCDAERDWLVSTIEALVRRESPTDDKAAVDRCGSELATRLTQIGGELKEITSTSAGNHLRASFGRGSRRLLLLGHFDTVWPVGEIDRMPFAIDGDRLKGPGVLDMKSGIALGMLATRALFELAAPSDVQVVMLWTTDEETGSVTSRALVETEARQSEAVLVLEPALPGGTLKTARKGCGEFELVVHGVAAHAGVDPDKGVSAIRELARQILAVETLQDPRQGVTVNVGIVHGGSRTNVVPAEAQAVVDVRAATLADAENVNRLFRKLSPHLPGARLEVRGGFNRPPMERTPGVARLFEIAQDVGVTLGQTVTEGATGGGSDGNFTAAVGVPTLDGLGAIGDGAHASHEHVLIPLLAPRAALIAGVLQRLAQS